MSRARGVAGAKDKAQRLEQRGRTEDAPTLQSTLDEDAFREGKFHDVSTREFYSQWDPSRASQSPSVMKKAD